MTTKREYSLNIKNKIITSDMLEDCLFSVNKRAKNCRDKIRDYNYRMWQNRYLRNSRLWDDRNRYEDKRDHYYELKEKLLTLLNPICIHKEQFYDRKDQLVVNHYLYYKMSKHSFHRPLKIPPDTDKGEWMKEMFPNLPIVDLEDPIETHGECTTDLISCNFVKKVLDLIESGDYTFEEKKAA